MFGDAAGGFQADGLEPKPQANKAWYDVLLKMQRLPCQMHLACLRSKGRHDLLPGFAGLDIPRSAHCASTLFPGD